MELFEFVLHLDEQLQSIVNTFGPLTYIILFLIVFAETGLVITPFLPGDSLLFIVGTLSGGGFLNIWISYLTLLSAAVIGDTVNYWIGHHLGPRVFSKENSKIFNKVYLEKTREFYVKHGGKTIILARFVPIIRTFAPFVAGIGRMHYSTFIFFNVIGAFIWVTSLTFAGYLFGGYPLVRDNFEYVIILIVLISLLPVIIEFSKHKLSKRKEQDTTATTYEEIEDTFKKEHLND